MTNLDLKMSTAALGRRALQVYRVVAANEILGCRCLTYSLYRSFSQTSTLRKNQRGKGSPGHHRVATSKVPDTGYDWIGPPNKDSNLRPVKFHICKDETPTERNYRERRQELQKWNQNFWAEHNTSFYGARERFVKEKLAEIGPTLPDGTPRKLTTSEMSEFYRCFLNENYRRHVEYNKEWYKRNISLLWPAVKVNIERLLWKKKAKETS
ncbi:APOPT family protein CBG23705, mitochondrial [Lingula anatina]|uniref:APOPT family protein CBG23705, mitochondrial n=1 Tax=Lingula anatina TaxID=7574 RepID=A0A1S3JLH7_LINAN|nr:APOPT family protein CBG23705, mitochondrial [Lingula anatina]|eukprot:XP_013410764.1 APOPT family protein CBG23705, mitochondrial [Lingula anatina]